MTSDLVTADEVALALSAISERTRETRTHGWYRVGPTAEVFSNGIPIALFNGVFAPRGGVDVPDPDEVGAALDGLKAEGLPYSLRYRPSAGALLEPLALERGLTLESEEPIMVLDDLQTLAHTPAAPELEIRRVTGSDYEAFLHAGAAAFEATYDEAAIVIPKVRLDDPAQRYWMGVVEGVPALIGCGVVVGEWVGIFNVGTAPAFRRRGYGAAITAQALRDGLEAGARHGVLTSSPMGFGVYSALGFRVIERWPFWVSA